MLTTMLSVPIYSITILQVYPYYTINSTPFGSTLSTTSLLKQNKFPHNQSTSKNHKTAVSERVTLCLIIRALTSRYVLLTCHAPAVLRPENALTSQVVHRRYMKVERGPETTTPTLLTNTNLMVFTIRTTRTPPAISLMSPRTRSSTYTFPNRILALGARLLHRRLLVAMRRRVVVAVMKVGLSARETRALEEVAPDKALRQKVVLDQPIPDILPLDNPNPAPATPAPEIPPPTTTRTHLRLLLAAQRRPAASGTPETTHHHPVSPYRSAVGFLRVGTVTANRVDTALGLVVRMISMVVVGVGRWFVGGDWR